MKKISTLSLLAVMLFACSEPQKAEEKQVTNQVSVTLTNTQIQQSEITEGMPTLENIGRTIFANGTIDVPPQNKSVISVQFGGFINSLSVMDGMNVKKGQVLMSIQHPDLIQIQQDYLEVFSNVDYLEAEMVRQKKLSEEEAGSLKSYQQAKAQYAVAQAQLSGLRAKLNLAGLSPKALEKGNIQHTINVKAPCSGIVSKVNAEMGMYAQPTDQLLEIIDIKNAHAEVTVFEKDIAFLKIGQKVKLSFTNYNETADAEVLLINRAINKDRTIRVHCEIKQPKDVLPGAYFKAAIFTGEQKLHCVPTEAIVDLKGKQVVFVGKPNPKGGKTFFPEEVRILATENGKSAIEYVRRGRNFDAPVVMKGAYDILSAILIREDEDE